MRYQKYAQISLFFMASSLAHGLDYEQKLLIENEGLDLTMLKGHPASHQVLTSESGQLSASSKSDSGLDALGATLGETPSTDDALSSLLGNSTNDISTGLDSLLGNDSDMPKKVDTSGLDNLLGDLNAEAPKESTGLEGLDSLFDTPAPEETKPVNDDPLANLDSLLADNDKPAKTETAAPSGLSGLDSFLGGLGGGIEIEEVKIEGLGSEEKKEPEPKKEEPKPIEKKEEPKPAKKEPIPTKAAQTKAPEKKEVKPKPTPQVKVALQADITPLERRLYVKSGTEFGQLLEQIAQLGGWELKTGTKFSELSKRKVSLSFQNVPLKFVLKWVSTQTGLKYKLSKETLSI